MKAAGVEGEVVFPLDLPVSWRRLTEEATNDETVELWSSPLGGGQFSTVRVPGEHETALVVTVTWSEGFLALRPWAGTHRNPDWKHGGRRGPRSEQALDSRATSLGSVNPLGAAPPCRGDCPPSAGLLGSK